MTIFTDIKELLTMRGAAQKSGRRVEASDLSIIKNAAMVEHQGQVAWVGEKKNLKKALKQFKPSEIKKNKEVSLQAQCVMPAFIDCHTHLVFAGDRKNEFEERNRGATYQEIAARGGGIRFTVRETQNASPAKLLKLAEERAQQLLAQGVTTAEVKSGYGLSHDDEIKILEVIKKIKSINVVPTYLGAHAVPTGRELADYLDEMIRKTLPYVRQKKLAERVDMFVESGYYSIDHAIKYFKAAKEMGFRITAHADQITRTGIGAFLTDSAWGVVDSVDHLVQIDSSDMEKLAHSELTCVLLPASDFYLKMKYPPARQLLDAGARVALSTDYNPGTSPTLSLNFVGVLARLEMRMSLPEVLAAYTVGAAHALQRQGRLGSLEVGKQADFVAFDCEWNDLFYQVGYHPVRHVHGGASQILKKT